MNGREVLARLHWKHKDMFVPFFYTVITLTSTGSELVVDSVCVHCHYEAMVVGKVKQLHTYQVDLNHHRSIHEHVNLEGISISSKLYVLNFKNSSYPVMQDSISVLSFSGSQ